MIETHEGGCIEEKIDASKPHLAPLELSLAQVRPWAVTRRAKSNAIEVGLGTM